MKFLKFFLNNRTLTIIISVVLAIFIVGIWGDLHIKNTIKNWSATNEARIQELEQNISRTIFHYQKNLLQRKNELQESLKSADSLIFEEVNRTFESKFDNNYIASIRSGDEIVYWNSSFDEVIFDSDTLEFKLNETHLFTSGIYSYLAVRDTFSLRNSTYTLIIAQIIEKQFELNEEYFTSLSLKNNISNEINLDITIQFSPIGKKAKDGRKHSFEIFSNYNNPIGIVTFIKPSRENAVKDLTNQIFVIQSLLVIFGFLLLGYLLHKEIKIRLGSKWKLIFITFYLITLRYLLIVLDFPSNIFYSEFLSDKFYHSNFGFGLAQSPIDLLFTLILALLLFTILYKHSRFLFFDQVKSSNNSYIGILIFILFLSIYILALRGFGAGVRGLVFDTNLRYFQDSALSLSFPHFLMHINLLLLGLISIIGSVSIFLIALRFLQKTIFKRLSFWILTFIFSICAILIFTIFQNHPQLTRLIKILHLVCVYILLYLSINRRISSIIFTIFIFLFSSFISIISLLNSNSELERASLKTTANIISRGDEEWFKSLISETLLESFSRSEAISAFSNSNNNFNSSAFKIWSKSKLQDESINSSVNFISLSGRILGGFGSVYPRIQIDEFIDTNSVIEEIQIFEEDIDNESQKLIRGVFPVKDEFAFLGYLDVSILADLNDFGFSSHPEFISTGKLNDKAIVKLDKLVILDYREDELKLVYGGINPNQLLNRTILNAEFSKRNDAWLDIDVNNFEYIIYVKKIVTEDLDRVIAVALKDRELSIRIFDFFKVFFSHSIILILILIVYLVNFFSKTQFYQYNLRTKLLAAFLIISLLPLILTAYYFRNLTEEKNSDAIYYKLGKRAFNIENYLADNFYDSSDDDIYSRASKDLNINYTLFKNEQIVYSSQDLLYDIGIISTRLAPSVYNELELKNSQEILIEEAIDKFEFNSFYYKAMLNNEPAIIKVSDGFNKIRLPLSGSEVDVFLFGFYFITAIIIIIFSFIFANQISSPIRKLTSATKSVAAGDLSLEIKDNSKGEIGDLESGFNYMIKELNRNQKILAEIEREEAWKEMAKQVAHEIKNPLTPMKLSVQQLMAAYDDKSDKFDKFFKKVTGTILNQIETLKNIATEFSNFARMPKLKIELIDCIVVINQSINLFTDEQIKIDFQHPNSSALVNGDKEQLKRTIINLIRNSIQASASKIKFDLLENDSTFVLYVNDNGHGISKENLDKVFEQNFTTKLEGMGLGLSMAKRYLRSTGGDINILESSSDGTSIELTLLKKI